MVEFSLDNWRREGIEVGESAQGHSAAGSKVRVPGQPSQLWISLAMFAER